MSNKLAPDIKFNKNGFEIRTDILNIATDLAVQEYKAKFGEWQMSVSQDKDGKLVHKIEMPDFPNLDIVLANADRLYKFVSNKQ